MNFSEQSTPVRPMQDEMITRFEAALNAMSDEELQAMWQQVRSEGVEGPTAADFIASFSRTPAFRNRQEQSTDSPS